MPPSLRLIVSDVDGCLTPGESGTWDWQALQTIQQINQRARHDPAVPALTLCTGRQEPYVEVLMQAIGGFVPCIYENGCGMYQPDGYRFLAHPALTPAVRADLAAARALVSEKVVAGGLGYLQPGKDLSLSVYPLPGVSLRSLQTAVQAGLSALGGGLAVHASASCIDVTPAGISKEHGVRWLADVTGIALDEMGGIGDSISDLSFLRVVGRSAAPGNALAAVKSAVSYVSPLANALGVLDIIRHWMSAASAATH